MHRCYMEPDRFRQNVFRIEGAEAHHLLRVLRVQSGDRLELFDGRGNAVTAEITETSRRYLTASTNTSAPRRTEPDPLCRITLMPGVIRPNRMDWTIEKAVELGMQGLRPVLSERSRTRNPDEGESAKMMARRRRIVIEAARQSGRCRLPEIMPPASLETVLKREGEHRGVLLLASLAPGARPMKRVLDGFTEPPERVGLLIGPEGDFTPGEQNLAIASGAVPVRLGRHVLRSETAAICALSILQGYLDGCPAQTGTA